MVANEGNATDGPGLLPVRPVDAALVDDVVRVRGRDVV